MTQWQKVAERVKSSVAIFLTACLAAICFLPAFASYYGASCAGKGRFELVEAGRPDDGRLQSIKIMSLNACFQDPWAPLTGGVVGPFEPVVDHPSRVAAVVDEIAKESPAVFVGQEFESLGAQDEAVRLLNQKGYQVFLRDLGSSEPIKNNSGLFVAAKVPLKDVAFVPYPAEDRAGLAKWSSQGALSFTVSLGDRDVRLINVHLNYGNDKEDQEARNRQLKKHVVPLMQRGPSVLMGDLNFDTAAVEKAAAGLTGFVNALEGQVTCTDEGRHALRGKPLQPRGKACTGCEERIDGFVYDPNQIVATNCVTKRLTLNRQLLSDHYATIATLKHRE